MKAHFYNNWKNPTWKNWRMINIFAIHCEPGLFTIWLLNLLFCLEWRKSGQIE